MIDSCGCYNSKDIFSDPSPEYNVVLEFKVVEFLFPVHVEDLKDMSFSSFHSCFKGHNVLFKMHDGSLDLSSWSSDKVELVEEFDNSELCLTILILISDGDVSFGLKMSDVEFEELGVES